jgi:hypothetical protein
LKNQLTNADALAIESAFAGKLNEQDQSNCNSSSEYRREDSDNASVSLAASENNVVVIAKSVRERDRQHLKFVSTQPCLVCGRTPSDPHHLKFSEARAMGRKVSDKYTVPLCRLHHRELHQRGDERKWWRGYGIKPLSVASGLWKQTHSVEISDSAGIT